MALKRLPQMDLRGLYFSVFLFICCPCISGTIPSVTVAECGESKTCFKLPTSCSGQSDCDYFVSWKPVNQSGRSYLEVEMAGKVKKNTGYIAIGWSMDNKMADSVIEACYNNPSRSVKFYSGFAKFQGPPFPTAHSQRGYMIASGPSLGGVYSAATKHIQCRYRRLVHPGDDRLGNLASGRHFVLAALGDVFGDSLQYHHRQSATVRSYNLVEPPRRSESMGTSPPSPSHELQSARSVENRGLSNITMSGCGKVKSCFMDPGCKALSSCLYFVSWRPFTENGTSWLEVELSGRLEDGHKTKYPGGYVAVGWSHDKRMGDDAVVGCIANPAGVISVRAAYNPSTYNEFVNSVSDDYLVTSGVNTAGQEPLLGGTFEASTNIVACRFRRILKPSSNAAKLKDLTPPNRYYILVSRSSSTTAGGLSIHFTGGHAVSSSPFVVGANNFTTAKSSERLLVKAHGVLMIVAWLLCANVGIIMARYMKAVWPSKLLGGVKVWFQVHRCIQILCVLLTVAAFIIIFVEIQGYSRLVKLPGSAHPILGIIVTVLALLNPLMAVFRPAPDAPKRPIFNWLHFFVGSLAQILSVATMFIGLKLEKLGTDFVSLSSPFWILVGYIIFTVVMEILFSIDQHCLKKKSTRAEQHQMKGIQNEASDYTIGNGVNGVDSSADDKAVNSKRRSFLLFIYCVGVIGCAAALAILLIIH